MTDLNDTELLFDDQFTYICEKIQEGFYFKALIELRKFNDEKLEKKSLYQKLFLQFESAVFARDKVLILEYLKEINDLHLENEISSYITFKLEILKTLGYAIREEIEQANNCFEEAENILANAYKVLNPETLLKKRHSNALLQYVKGRIFVHDNKRKESKLFFEKALEISAGLNNYQLQADSLNQLALAEMNLGNITKALELIQQGLKYIGLTNNLYLTAQINGDVGLIYFELGDKNLALKYHHKALQFACLIKDKRALLAQYNNIGRIYIHHGNYDEAINYLLKSCELSIQLDQFNSLSANYLNIGLILEIKGQLEDATSFYKAVVKMESKIDKIYIGGVFNQLGEIHYHFGNYDKAIDYLEASYKIFTEKKFHLYTHKVLYILIEIYIEKNNVEKANSLMCKLTKLACELKTDEIKLIEKFAQTKILTNSKILRNIAKAQSILEELVEDQKLEFIYRGLAAYDLCQLYFTEYKLTKNTIVLDSIERIINDLTQENNSKKFYLQRILLALLRLDLALIKEQKQEVEKQITEALKLTSQNKYIRLHDLVKLKMEENKVNNKSFDLENLNDSDLKEFALEHFDEILKSLAEEKPLNLPDLSTDEPIQFLIMSKEMGVTIYSKKIAPEFSDNDSQLLGGLLSALKDFSSEIFKDNLDSINIGMYSIKVINLENLTFCYIYTGSSYFASQKLEAFRKHIIKNQAILSELKLAANSGLLFNESMKNHIESILESFFI